MQPLDARIINHFKLKYQQSLLNNLIAPSETPGSIQDNIKMITLKHSTNWIYLAWNNIDSSVIQDCLKHVGIKISPVEETSSEDDIRHFLIQQIFINRFS